MKLITTLLTLALLNGGRATGGENERGILQYEIARLNNNYLASMKRAQEQNRPLVVWVNVDDYAEYSKISQSAIHVFLNKFDKIEKGVVLGIPSGHTMYRYDFQDNFAERISARLNPTKTDPPKPRIRSCPDGTCNPGGKCLNGGCEGNCPGGNCDKIPPPKGSAKPKLNPVQSLAPITEYKRGVSK